MHRLIFKILVTAACLTVFSLAAEAQFKEDAFNQSYYDGADSLATKDSVDRMWSFKEFFHGVAHHDSTLRIGSLFAGSTVFIGSEQFYNRQYWKLPVVYAGIGAGLGMGFHYKGLYDKSKEAYEAAYELDPETTVTVDKHSKDMATYMFASAGLVYWATLMDGIVNYKKDVKNQAGKATIYSILLPGLGQIYNHEAWKIPLYWGLMAGSYHYYSVNRKNYKRFKRIHNEITAEGSTYSGYYTAERALYFRNVFRRYRDYSMVCIIGSYLLQVIDANVFAYMQDFEVGDDLSLKVTPALISPYGEYACGTSVPRFSFGQGAFGDNAIGIKVGVTF